jgi:hypothetical protein
MFTVATEGGSRSLLDQRWDQGRGDDSETPLSFPEADELLAVAQGLADTARHWSGVTGMRGRRWELVAEAETFEAWIIGWPPGGTITLHDHGDSAGAIFVARGALVETFLTEDVSGAITAKARRMSAGRSWAMSKRHVHDVVNHGLTPAVSVHVYAPRLTSMTHYRLDAGVLSPQRTVHYQFGDVVP